MSTWSVIHVPVSEVGGAMIHAPPSTPSKNILAEPRKLGNSMYLSIINQSPWSVSTAGSH